ncbi:MAG: ABC transporter ATP-binding protein [Phycisphaerae bacterium]|nr:ABC transporter ATP-binding protein [Phycisphaerae bacterium]MCZ2399326.1 ABC transporter ATP-binding protein [Phycisphaerae bacterium]
MLEVESLTVAAGTFRLRDVNLRVPAGECHAVLGPSGSGKSTLLHAILGLLRCERGRVRIDGADVASVPIERRGLGYVPQQLGLFPHLSVRDNLAYSARARGLPRAGFQPLLDELIAATGIGQLLERRPATLSGGERQRVGLVRALASRPRLVLLDEPFMALNASLRRELWWLVRELQRNWRLTVLLVTHDLAEAYFLADCVTVLLDGRVVQQGDKAEVYGRPAAAEVARFLGVETLQPGRIVERREGLVVVEAGSARLTALAPDGVSDLVLVSIRGEDVMLERESDPPRIASARNRLPARVVSVQPGSPLLCVELDAGFPLFALVTRPACEELALQPGTSVTAVVKAPAVHLLNRTK